MKIQRTALAAATLAAIIGLDAAAQQPVLEEVIVVAQKREESLQETAIAITALTSDMFDSLNISNSGDYEAIVPSLSVRDEPARLSLRGVGRVTNSLGTEPGIAVYVDQVYNSEIGTLSRATSLTTERVEVLRGPQGTLFGRNATGGAVNVTSKRPTQDFEHHLRATVGNYDTVNLGASSSGPITDSLGYRVYAYQQTRDGYIENQSGDDIWDLENSGYGAQLSWDISDTLNLWVSYARDETDDSRSGLLSPGVLITSYETELPTQDGFFYSEQYQWSKANPTVKDIYKIDYNDVLRAKDDDNNKFTAHLTWNLDAMTVRYIGSYIENEFTGESGDFGFTSNPDVRGLESVEQVQDSSSHEVQFISESASALQWVAGLYYWEEDKSQPYRAYTPTAFFLDYTVDAVEFTNPATLQANPGRDQVRQQADLDSESWAAYADVNYNFNESWKLTVGVRYTRDEKTGFESQFIAADVLAVPGANALIPVWQALGFPENCCGFLVLDENINQRDLKDEWSNVSGRVVLDYTPSDDTLIYASIANGYKAGGFNLGTLTPDPTFDEETVLSYEIGYKGTFNDVLRLNAAAYFYDYSDMQVRVPRLTDQNLPVQELTNAAESEVFGLELEATWLATGNLTFIANYSYLDGEYTDFCCIVDTIGDPTGDPKDLSGNPLIQAPENKFFVNASYAIPTSSAGEWVLSGSYSWVDERQYDAFDTPETLADSYYRLDGMVTWFSPSSAWRVILSGRNLTDEETYTSLNRLNSTGALTAWPNAPRTYSLEVQYDF